MSNAEPYIVTVVVDPAFGDRLAELPSTVPVWIIESPANRAAVQRAWAGRSSSSTHLDGVTIFRGEENDAAASCKGVLSDIDLHHGAYSHVPPFTGLEVIGAELTPELSAALAEYGLTQLTPRANGFRASKAEPTVERVAAADGRLG
jgi:hypothetical protein